MPRDPINEEAGLGDNWVPLDKPPIIPAPPTHPADQYLQGSVPPAFQQNVDFVRVRYEDKNVPQLSIAPAAFQATAASNAAIQSTSSVTPSVIPPSPGTVTISWNVPTVLFNAIPTTSLPGTVSIFLASQGHNLAFMSPDGSSGTPIFRSMVNNDLPVVNVAHGGTGDSTLTAHGVLVGAGASPVNTTTPGTAGQVLTSNGPSLDPTFQALPSPLNAAVKINGVGTALDKQVFIKGVTDGAAVWGFSINGTPDGG